MLDLKRATHVVVKPTAIIKRSKILGNTLIRGKPFYNSDTNKAFNVCKNGKNTSML